jgi:hypothetical protein
MATAVLKRASTAERQAVADRISELSTLDAELVTLRQEVSDLRSAMFAAGDAVEAAELAVSGYGHNQRALAMLDGKLCWRLAPGPGGALRNAGDEGRGEGCGERSPPLLGGCAGEADQVGGQPEELCRRRAPGCPDGAAMSPAVKDLSGRLVAAQQHAVDLGQKLYWLAEEKVVPFAHVNPDPPSQALHCFFNAAWDIAPTEGGSRPLKEALQELLIDPGAMLP